MRAAILERARRMIQAERPIPRPKQGEVLLRVEACGLNERDLDSWYYGLGTLPRVPGSEIVATAVDSGDQVGREDNIISLFSDHTANLAAGSRLIVLPNVYGGIGEPSIIGFDRDGGLQEYLRCPLELCIEVLEESFVNDLVWVPGFAEALGYMEELQVEGGEIVIVSGAESSGVLTAVAAQLCGANVILVDPNQARLELAREAGVEYTLNPLRASVPEELEWFAPKGSADVVVETSGDSAALPGLLAVCGAGTRVGLISEIDFDIPLSTVVGNGLRLIGLGTITPNIPAAMELIGKTTVGRIVSLTLPLEEVPRKTCGIANARKTIVKTVVTATPDGRSNRETTGLI